MSRGLGKVQREVLDAVERMAVGRPPQERWVRTSVIAGLDASPSRLESVRRAVRTLRARGMVETASFGRVRKPLDDRERRREVQAFRRAQQALDDAEYEVERARPGFLLQRGDPDDRLLAIERFVARVRRHRLRRGLHPS